MGKLKMTLACWDHPRLRPILDGLIEPEGIELNPISLPPHEIFWRMLKYEDFDASELSLSGYIIDQCSASPRFIAIPFFPSRVFRHSALFINKNAGIRTPEDLKGKKVGVPEYHLTAALWVRGFLQHDYGVSAEDIEWHMGGIEEAGRKDRIEVKLPKKIRLHEIPEDQTLSEWLERGLISALISPHKPRAFSKGTSNAALLFPNFREIEKEYFDRTGILPIMHTIVVKRKIYEKHPWVTESLYKALASASSFVESNFSRSGLRYTIPWLQQEWEEARRIFGQEIFPSGVAQNLKSLEAVVRYSYEQGLATREFKPADLFAPNTVEQFKD
ncbi:MAG: ABC transporter substrate-binding protein [Deltaproteobacteria bacterium]|nr:ABC transporter substrate-binding protein [Deltaproteobacteria bacterium]